MSKVIEEIARALEPFVSEEMDSGMREAWLEDLAGAAYSVMEKRLGELEEALRPFAAMRLSVEPEINDCLWRSHGAQLREQAAAIELRDAQIGQARAALNNESKPVENGHG